MPILSRLLLAAILCLSFIASANPNPYQYIKIPKANVTQAFIEETGFIIDHKYDYQYAYGYVMKEALKGLSTFSQQITEETLETPNYEGYHNYQQLTEKLQNLADENPDILRLYSAGSSVNGRNLWYVKISDRAQFDENEPKLLYVGNMHGDEVVGREMMIKLIDKLVSEYQSNDEVKQLIDHSQIYIMPSMNPDGFENGSRFNQNYSDLNRDFPDFTTDPNDSQNGREPETKAIMKLHNQHHFVLAINYHGGDVCFNLPWDTIRNRGNSKFSDDPTLSHLGRLYANQNPVMVRQTRGSFDRGLTYGYEWYEVNGGLQDWANYYRRSTHATVELSFKKWPSGNTLDSFWSDNESSIINYLFAGRTGVHLDITGLPENSFYTVKVGDRELRYNTADQTKIHRVTLDGVQNVTVKSGGESIDLELLAEPFTGSFVEVAFASKG